MLWGDPRAATTIQKRTTEFSTELQRRNQSYFFVQVCFETLFIYFFLMPDKGGMVNRLPTGRFGLDIWEGGGDKVEK